MRRLCGVVCVLVTSICQLGMSGLTNPPSPNIDYALAFSPQAGGLVMDGGWCDPEWKPRTSTWVLTEMGWEPGPDGPAMMHHSGALDTHRNVVVVCGRTNYPNNNINVTYEFNGAAWVQKASLVAGNDGDVELAYDSARRKMVAFVSDGTSSETWEYDGTNWTKIITATTPRRARWGEGALLTYNPLQGKTLLVVPEPQPGKAGMFVSETWAYDGTDWSMVASGTPTNAFRAGMAYDAARSNVVLLTTDSETWIWNGTAWTPRYPAHSPTPARGYFTMGYDPLRERAVIFSGEAGEFPSATYPIDTWEWDGVDWQQFVPVPEPMTAVAVMAVLVGVLRRK